MNNGDSKDLFKKEVSQKKILKHVTLETHFFFKACRDNDVDIKTQREYFDNMLKEAKTWNYYRFVEKLKKSMTSEVFTKLKRLLQGKIYIKHIERRTLTSKC